MPPLIIACFILRLTFLVELPPSATPSNEMLFSPLGISINYTTSFPDFFDPFIAPISLLFRYYIYAKITFPSIFNPLPERDDDVIYGWSFSNNAKAACRPVLLTAFYLVDQKQRKLCKCVKGRFCI